MDDLVRDFVVETREGLEALDCDLVRFEREPGDPDLLGRIFRVVHTVKGTCGFLGLPRLQSVAHAAENVLGGFRDGTLPVSTEAVSAVLQAVDGIRGIVRELDAAGAEPEGEDAALIARLDRASRPQGSADAAQRPARLAAARPLIERLGGDATLDAACEGLRAALQAGGEWRKEAARADADYFSAAVRDALCQVARGLADADAFSQALGRFALSGAAESARAWLTGSLARLEADPGAVDELFALALPPRAEPPAASPRLRAESGGEGPAQTIRVGVDALEHLMTVASELVLIRNQLIQTLREQPESPFASPLHRLNQVTSELQESVMTTRMQPISGAWSKLPRLVRDLAADLGKTIELEMQGRDTELDRQVLELIKDPLIHMVRNAADHGLEPTAERVAAGKPAAGRITLQARHEGGAILIDVADDGRGLPVSRIRAKAVAAGLATQAAAEAMTDEEVRRFIFAAGFSTAASVTAVSGRGVGMDVVRTNIEKIAGAIEVFSAEGVGTRFTIRIPLTLTIVSALIVESAGLRFAMPQSSVVELVGTSGASGKTVERVGGSAVLRLRDRLLPLVSLRQVLGLPPAEPRRAGCIVIARVGAVSFGVIVDRVFDIEEIVVKPVAKALRHLRVYAGTTILGDGSVIMILDLKGVAAETGASQSSPADLRTEPASEPTTPLLVFRAGDGALKAAPLSDVDRIEEITPAQIEAVENRSVVQYRGRLMPVVADALIARADAVQARSPMLVFSRDRASVGLLVGEIVDIVDTALAIDLEATTPGSRGSLIVAGAATELIDVSALWSAARARERSPAPAA